MLRSAILVFSCIFLIPLTPTCISSQTESRRIVITSEISGPTRQITATRIATIGMDADTLDATFFLVSPSLIRMQNGNFLLTPTMGRTPGVYEFASDGSYIRQIGRRGSGPGEYRNPVSIALGQDDSLFVFNSWPPRVSVFSSEGMFVRSSSIPLRVELALPMASGEILVMGKRTSPELLGLPLHLLTSTGESVHSFGDENPINDPRDGSLYRRHISHAPDGTVWVSPEYRYRVERWDIEGNLIESIIREAEWFPPRTPTVEEPLIRERPAPRMLDPGPPHFFGAFQDSDGMLWLNSVVSLKFPA